MSGAFFRVDKFIVPAAAREEFLVKVMMTHKVLEAQDGFIDHRTGVMDTPIDARRLAPTNDNRWSA
ncbi:hypothetical protein ACCS35_34555, partial [Rhizobium johnstonii]